MAAKVVTYPVALAELTLAMVVFARTLHVGRTSALAAALLAALLVFPFYGTGAIYPVLYTRIGGTVSERMVDPDPLLRYDGRDTRRVVEEKRDRWR